MNFQQRYLRLSKEIKNIKEAQSKVVLDLRSVVYTSTQTMQYDHYWGRFTYLSVYLEDENGFDVRDNSISIVHLLTHISAHSHISQSAPYGEEGRLLGKLQHGQSQSKP